MTRSARWTLSPMDPCVHMAAADAGCWQRSVCLCRDAGAGERTAVTADLVSGQGVRASAHRRTG